MTYVVLKAPLNANQPSNCEDKNYHTVLADGFAK